MLGRQWKPHRLLAVVLLVVTGCSGPAPTPTITPIPTITPTPAPNAQRYAADTTIPAFNYKATGILTIEGTFKLASGTLLMTPNGTDSSYRMRVTLIIDGNSLTAPGDFWMGLMRNVLQTSKFPTATFDGVAKDPIVFQNGTGMFTAAGSLELRGRKRPLEIPFTITREGNTLKGTGRVSIDLGQYDIPVPTAIMSPMMQFVINVTARPAS